MGVLALGRVARRGVRKAHRAHRVHRCQPSGIERARLRLILDVRHQHRIGDHGRKHAAFRQAAHRIINQAGLDTARINTLSIAALCKVQR
jgi:hypothetical protein